MQREIDIEFAPHLASWSTTQATSDLDHHKVDLQTVYRSHVKKIATALFCPKACSLTNPLQESREDWPKKEKSLSMKQIVRSKEEDKIYVLVSRAILNNGVV